MLVTHFYKMFIKSYIMYKGCVNMYKEILIENINDFSWYDDFMVTKNGVVGKIHLPKFLNGQIIIRFYAEDSVIKDIDQCPDWFKKAYYEILAGREK